MFKDGGKHALTKKQTSNKLRTAFIWCPPTPLVFTLSQRPSKEAVFTGTYSSCPHNHASPPRYMHTLLLDRRRGQGYSLELPLTSSHYHTSLPIRAFAPFSLAASWDSEIKNRRKTFLLIPGFRTPTVHHQGRVIYQLVSPTTLFIEKIAHINSNRTTNPKPTTTEEN